VLPARTRKSVRLSLKHATVAEQSSVPVNTLVTFFEANVLLATNSLKIELDSPEHLAIENYGISPLEDLTRLIPVQGNLLPCQSIEIRN